MKNVDAFNLKTLIQQYKKRVLSPVMSYMFDFNLQQRFQVAGAKALLERTVPEGTPGSKYYQSRAGLLKDAKNYLDLLLELKSQFTNMVAANKPSMSQ